MNPNPNPDPNPNPNHTLTLKLTLLAPLKYRLPMNDNNELVAFTPEVLSADDGLVYPICGIGEH